MFCSSRIRMIRNTVSIIWVFLRSRNLTSSEILPELRLQFYAWELQIKYTQMNQNQLKNFRTNEVTALKCLHPMTAKLRHILQLYLFAKKNKLSSDLSHGPCMFTLSMLRTDKNLFPKFFSEIRLKIIRTIEEIYGDFFSNFFCLVFFYINATTSTYFFRLFKFRFAPFQSSSLNLRLTLQTTICISLCLLFFLISFPLTFARHLITEDEI